MPSQRKKITEQTLRGLKAEPKEWFIRDETQPGFQIKVLPSGQAVYQVEARMGGKGKVKKFKLGNVTDIPLADARKRAGATLDQIRSGIDPQIEKRKQLFEGMTLEQLVDAYIGRPNHALKPRTIKDYRSFLDKQFKPWKNKRVADISKYEVVDWYKAGKKTPVHTHNAYRALRALMNYARGLSLIQENPCDYVAQNKIQYKIKEKTSHIEANHDLGRFLKAFIEYKCDKDSQKVARDLILLMLVTGLRFSEARTLKFEQINFNRRYFTVPDTKNGRDHIVPLVPLTYTMLRYRKEKWKEKDSPYVFRIKGGDTKSPYTTDIRKTLHGICDAAGVTKVSAHDLRRTFASTINNIGVGYADMKALMNHKSKDITAVYIQNNMDKLRKYMDEVVSYYDLKIIFPDRGPQTSKNGTDVIQAALYGNVEATFDYFEEPQMDSEAERQREEEYWLGFDAEKVKVNKEPENA